MGRFRISALLATLTAATVGAELLPAPVSSQPWPALVPAASARAAGLAPPRHDFASVILARPLFSSQRRPPALAVAPLDARLPRLSAVITTLGGRIAIFDGRPSIGIAGRIGIYTVSAITPDSVKLSGPYGRITVHPQFAAAGTGIAAAMLLDAVDAPPRAQVLHTGLLADESH